MADQEEARLAPSRTLALLSLPSTARVPATYAVLAIIRPFEHCGACRVQGAKQGANSDGL